MASVSGAGRSKSATANRMKTLSAWLPRAGEKIACGFTVAKPFNELSVIAGWTDKNSQISVAG